MRPTIYKSSDGEWHSQLTPPFLDYAPCAELKGAVLGFLQQLNDGLGTRLKLATSWANVTRKGCGMVPHNHSSVPVAGVVFVAATVQSGRLLFPQVGVNYAPAPCDCLVFLGKLMHEVTPNLDDVPRISIAFEVEA